MLTTTMQNIPEADGEKRKKVGHYILGSVLGEGSFTKVRIGTHIVSREKVAVKVVSKRLMIQRESARRHFRREALLLQHVSHPHVVKLLEAMETPNSYYLVLELAEKGHLQDYITDRKCLEEEEARRFMRQIVSAIDHLHQSGIVHRDLKLENFLLNSALDIKIVDFGLSSLCQRQNSLHTQCGSPAYAAPEIFSNRRYGASVDMWSLGVCLYAMVIGRLPFLSEHQDNLAQLHALILRGATIPSFLTTGLQELLSGLLEIQESNRLTITDVLKHSWITCNGNKPITRHPEVAKAPPIVIDTSIVKCMTTMFGFNESDVLHSVTSRKLNASSATYFLLKRRLDGGHRLNGTQLAGDVGNNLAVPSFPGCDLPQRSQNLKDADVPRTSGVPEPGNDNSNDKTCEGAKDYKECILCLREARLKKLALFGNSPSSGHSGLGELSNRRSSLPKLPSLSTSFASLGSNHQARSRQTTPTDAVRTSVYPAVTHSIHLNVNGMSAFQGKKTPSGSDRSSVALFPSKTGHVVASAYATDVSLPPPPPNTAYGARGREWRLSASDHSAVGVHQNPEKVSPGSASTLKDPFGCSHDSWSRQQEDGGEKEAKSRKWVGVSFLGPMSSRKALMRRTDDRFGKSQGHSVFRQIAADLNRKRTSPHGTSPHRGETQPDDHVNNVCSSDDDTTGICDNFAGELAGPRTDIPFSGSLDREEFLTPVIRVTITSTNKT